MGWQKRSTDKVYTNLSGHAYMIGCQTINSLDLVVKCKKFDICRDANKCGATAKEHSCVINCK